MRENVTVEGPDSRIVAVHDDVPSLTGSNVECIAFPWRRLIPSILRYNGHVHSVKVHRMNHHSFIHVSDTKLVTVLHLDWLSCRKAFSIEGVAVHSIVEDHDVVDVYTFLDWHRILRLDDECAKH